jgi:hypothetical protein
VEEAVREMSIQGVFASASGSHHRELVPDANLARILHPAIFAKALPITCNTSHDDYLCCPRVN